MTVLFVQVLHYATELFEGLKAYRGVDNKIRLFRPEMNMRRMRLTAARASLPVRAGQFVIDHVRVDVDVRWRRADQDYVRLGERGSRVGAVLEHRLALHSTDTHWHRCTTLSRFLSHFYFCPFFRSISSFVPQGGATTLILLQLTR
jgi:hypothetical protein